MTQKPPIEEPVVMEGSQAPGISHEELEEVEKRHWLVDNDISYVIDHLVEQGWHHSRETRLYHTRWYISSPEEHTWEPMENLPRSHIVRYHPRRRMALPDSLDRARVGVLENAT